MYEARRCTPVNMDTSLSLEVILAILAILGAVWRLEGRIADSRRELGGDIRRLDEKVDESRKELRGDILRLETRIDRVDAKVDEGNQRLARLEGRFEGREERLTAEGEAESPA